MLYEVITNEVNEARQDRERTINQAQERANREIPKARGEATRTITEAEGYAVERVNRASGEATRFRAVLAEYHRITAYNVCYTKLLRLTSRSFLVSLMIPLKA